MRTDLRALLDHDNAEAGVELHQPAGSRQPGRAATNDDYVEFH